MKIIARIRNDFTEKFGIPRQSGLTTLRSRIVFEPEYRNADALRGIEDFSHLWLIWQFSEAVREDWSPTVRPPRLGGNKRMGVFATRSPFRPNPIGLSSVRLCGVEYDTSEGAVLIVEGADILDGTPIYDIKPYLPYTDCHSEAASGFALTEKGAILEVKIPPELECEIPEASRQGLREILSQDPRPQYQNDPERVYSMKFGRLDISFKVSGNVLMVIKIEM